jgi:hypothetical protein
MELHMKKSEIQYSIKTRKFIKKTFVNKIPNELILEIIKYVGFNEIHFNPYNMLYKYYNYYNYGSYSNLQVVKILMNNNFNREWETNPA